MFLTLLTCAAIAAIYLPLLYALTREPAREELALESLTAAAEARRVRHAQEVTRRWRKACPQVGAWLARVGAEVRS